MKTVGSAKFIRFQCRGLRLQNCLWGCFVRLMEQVFLLTIFQTVLKRRVAGAIGSRPVRQARMMTGDEICQRDTESAKLLLRVKSTSAGVIHFAGDRINEM